MYPWQDYDIQLFRMVSFFQKGLGDNVCSCLPSVFYKYVLNSWRLFSCIKHQFSVCCKLFLRPSCSQMDLWTSDEQTTNWAQLFITDYVRSEIHHFRIFVQSLFRWFDGLINEAEDEGFWTVKIMVIENQTIKPIKPSNKRQLFTALWSICRKIVPN